ncbi:MAG TPA: DUF1549 and DUF1553 domain-containing protein [Pirellulaceae bacterium]|jgi:hypothetical protein
MRPVCLPIAVHLALATFTYVAAAEPVRFERDVMAVLSKSGCNLGACHGNFNGKGGFRLSLRGEDPSADYAALLRQVDQRRVNLLDPEASLILQKPTGQVVHQGGLRFNRDSVEYQILRDWIAAGAPGPSINPVQLVRLVVTPREPILIDPIESAQLQVTAHFADGSKRDVTELACYEATNRNVEIEHDGLVRREKLGQSTVLVRYLTEQLAARPAFLPAQTDFSWSAPPASNYIDRLNFQQLQKLRMNPSLVCDDTTFLRRAYLDCLGLLPSADEARVFLASQSPEKRSRLIDDLLARPEFADHWAMKWSDVLRNEEKALDAKGVDAFFGWIRDWIAAGRPLDEFARQLITGRGSTYENPPANFYRANRDPTTRGETAARLFLGVRLQCAKCHNHPYDRWTQDDYYNWAAVFGRIDYQIVSNQRRDRLDKHEFNGEQIVVLKDEGEVQNARTGLDAEPRFLGGYSPPLHPAEDRLMPLAEWLTAPDNELFVKSQVNFIWYHLVGRGLVEPIDDFRVTNPPSNPALLDALARQFAASDFDLRTIVREILNSQTYQLSSEPNESNRDDEVNFARAIILRLPAETLLDAQCEAIDAFAEFNGYPEGTRAGQVRGVQRVRSREKKAASADRFLKTFGKPERLLACECERSNETTLKQALTLIGDEGLNALLAKDGNRLSKLAESGISAEQTVDELYWAALSRAPTLDELAAGESLVTSAGSERFAALQDLAWAILNSKEFVFRH